MVMNLLSLLLHGRGRPARVFLVYCRPRASNQIPLMHYIRTFINETLKHTACRLSLCGPEA